MKHPELKKYLLDCLAKGKREKLYRIAKVIAESDSVGEGYGYCSNYTRSMFAEETVAIRDEKDRYDQGYLAVALEVMKIK